MPIQTRRQLATDPEMCMFALTIIQKNLTSEEKALYGLKQAPRAWYDELSNFLMSKGFTKGIIDPTLFKIKYGEDILLVQIYVDDIIFRAFPDVGSWADALVKSTSEGYISYGDKLVSLECPRNKIALPCLPQRQSKWRYLQVVLKKALPEDRFKYLVQKIRMRILSSQRSGGSDK
ncbi:retrovirus-related pol polyprotein from transposon TNT 1-94 [Tanacetum coccineum]|uniref:Retrovirus-related pol polyprotein from transposon TNT 1-94 n=1 Tax=Tanacetum coccineum TaxID=301880 RepID=A0ABQ4Z7P9_9ASTR